MEGCNATPKVGQKTRQPAETEIRAALAKVLKQCRTKKRSAIAEELSALVGAPVTEGMLNDLCSTSKKGLRVPLSWVRAICEITGSDELAYLAMTDDLRERAEIGTSLRPALKKWDNAQSRRRK